MLAAKLAIVIVVVVLSSQQLLPDHQVALRFTDRTEIVTLAEAQAEFAALDKVRLRTAAQESRHAALNLALGTIPDERRRDECSKLLPYCSVLQGGTMP